MAALVWTLAWGLAWFLAGVVLLVLAILVTPVRIDVALRSPPDAGSRVRLKLLGGLTPWLPITDTSGGALEAEKAPEPKPKKMRKKHRRPKVAIARLAKKAPHLLADILRPIHIENLALDADIGLGDPAATGQLYGYLTPLIYATPGKVWRLTVRPDFDRARFEGEVDARLQFIPVAFVPPVLRVAWTAFGPAK